jgi:hypothetical protein
MALSYLLAPEPKWIILENDGTPAGGAKLYTYRSLNKTEPKNVYQDPGGTVPWTNPIIFDLNGTQGPFYWTVDSDNPNETYYLEVYNSNGDLLWTQDSFLPPGSGGGGNVTTYIPIINYITNNQFINHGSPTANPTNSTNLLIAPSNHKGFTPALINPVVGTYGVVGPDIRFIKNNTAATDQITYPTFALGSAPLTGDVTPVEYVRYQCTNSPAGETYKNFQFPITQKVKNLSNQAMTFSIWAAVTATPVTINIYLRQYFGSGTAASPDTRTLIGSCVLSTTWTSFNINFTVPTVAGKSIGTPGAQTDDDAIYIQVEMPLGAPCDVLFIKPSLYLGNIDPHLEFESYDQIDSINSTARCGDVKTSLLSTAPNGWLLMNDVTIGNTTSGAVHAGAFTFQLYKTLWDGILNTWAPVSGGRGATAVADFIANKTLSLPLSLGRALSNQGTGTGLTARALGQNSGSEVITMAAMPAHNHTGSTASVAIGAGQQVNPAGTNGSMSSLSGPTVVSLNIAAAGGGTLNVQGAADGNIPPTTYMNVFIKL